MWMYLWIVYAHIPLIVFIVARLVVNMTVLRTVLRNYVVAFLYIFF